MENKKDLIIQKVRVQKKEIDICKVKIKVLKVVKVQFLREEEGVEIGNIIVDKKKEELEVVIGVGIEEIEVGIVVGIEEIEIVIEVEKVVLKIWIEVGIV